MARQVTITEAAAILGVSRKTVKNLIAAGKLTATKVGRLRVVELPDEVVLPTETKPTIPEPPPAPDAALLAAQLAQVPAGAAPLADERAVRLENLHPFVARVDAGLPAQPRRPTDAKRLGADRDDLSDDRAEDPPRTATARARLVAVLAPRLRKGTSPPNCTILNLPITPTSVILYPQTGLSEVFK